MSDSISQQQPLFDLEYSSDFDTQYDPDQTTYHGENKKSFAKSSGLARIFAATAVVAVVVGAVVYVNPYGVASNGGSKGVTSGIAKQSFMGNFMQYATDANTDESIPQNDDVAANDITAVTANDTAVTTDVSSIVPTDDANTAPSSAMCCSLNVTKKAFWITVGTALGVDFLLSITECALYCSKGAQFGKSVAWFFVAYLYNAATCCWFGLFDLCEVSGCNFIEKNQSCVFCNQGPRVALGAPMGGRGGHLPGIGGGLAALAALGRP